VSAAALVGVLSGGAAIWLAVILGAAAIAAVRSLGVAAGLRTAAAFAVATVAMCVPVLAPGGLLPPTSAPLTSATALGNLGRPLSTLHLFGVWPAGDFRLDAAAPAVTYTLIGLVGGAALFGLYVAWRARAWGVPLYVGGALVACAVIVIVGSPWVAAKAMAIAAPAIVLAAMIGTASVIPKRHQPVSEPEGSSWESPERTQPVYRWRLAGVVLLAAIAGGVVWSNALAYRDVNLAPRDQLAELETIGHRIAGRGPTLMTEYEPYGVRHFLRDADPEGASELRRRVVPLRGGGTLHKGMTADTDRFQLDGLLIYRTLVLRRSPFQSRPPTPYRLIWRGHYYEAWQRPGRSTGSVIDHLGLGGPVDPAAVPRCGAVRRLAREAGPGGELVAVARKPNETIRPAATVHPPAWEWAGFPKSLLPVTPGTLGATARITHAGEYDVWLGGSIRPDAGLRVDGRPVGEVRGQLNNEGEYVQLGRVRLARGEHRLTIDFHGADLHPGSGGVPSPVGPLVLSPQDAADTRLSRFQAKEASRLCGSRWDWIEAKGR
jgi:hypothetical protein